MNMMEAKIFKVLGVDKEIKVFQRKLGIINGYVQQIERNRLEIDEIDIWEQKLKDVMYDADDIIDICMIEAKKLLKAQALSGSSTVSTPFSYLFSCFQCLKYRHDIANQIITLNSRLDDLEIDNIIKIYFDQITKENNLDQATEEPIEYVNRVIETSYNLDQATEEPVEYVNRVMETSYLQTEGDIVGTQIENATETLCNLILENIPKKCRVFGVVGTGGIGKTTLASKIFEDERIKENFPTRIWLHVSKNYLESDLLKRLIRFQERSEIKTENLERKIKIDLANLFSSIFTYNTFIVLDDVWNSSVWVDFLRNPIMASRGSFTVLVTSRKEKVVMLMKPRYIHPVEKMDEENGWTLLKHLIFEDEDDDVISSFEEIGSKLVNKCDGLPLAIKAIAGVLYQQNKARWEEVLQSDAWNMDQIVEELRPLYLSYEELPSRLKQHFLYCSLYPQKDVFSKKVIQFWVAEGLIMDRRAAEGLIMDEQDNPLSAEGLIMDEQDNSSGDLPTEILRTMEDLGEKIYREFISRNLLESVDLSKNYFSMHNHFRSLCANLMREEGILYRHGREFTADENVTIRRLSISCMGPKLVLPTQILRQACLRTLILTDSPETKIIEDSVLRALPRLRVLDLANTSIEMIPDCIGDLLHLRFLNLDATNIRVIPMTIRNLVNLQTLNISECLFLERLPGSITELHNLRWLNMINCPLLTYVPKGIGKLENFYCLQGFMVGQNDSASEEGCDLEELKNLYKLRALSIYRLERADGGASALANKPFLKDLTLGWMQPDEEEEDAKADEEADEDGKDDGDSNKDMGDGNDDGSGAEDETEETENEEKGWSEEQISKAERICNEMTQPSSTIFDLLFDEYPGQQFPSWMTSSYLALSFPNLTYLKLVGLPCCSELPPLGTLPQLKYLRIERASAITAIGSQFLGSRSSAFPKLEVLHFEDMPTWEEWTFNETPLAVKLFPSLRECLIFNCPKLRALPDGLHRATNLNQLYLRQTYELAEINNLTLAYKLEVTNGNGLKKISNIPSLRYLQVDNCPNLERAEDLGKLQHLELICSEETEQLPRWLPGLIEQHNNTASIHRSLRKFEMECNLQLLKSCLKGNENWDIIKQIPDVKVQIFSGKEYLRYTKDPYIYDSHVPPD